MTHLKAIWGIFAGVTKYWTICQVGWNRTPCFIRIYVFFSWNAINNSSITATFDRTPSRMILARCEPKQQTMRCASNTYIVEQIKLEHMLQLSSLELAGDHVPTVCCNCSNIYVFFSYLTSLTWALSSTAPLLYFSSHILLWRQNDKIITLPKHWLNGVRTDFVRVQLAHRSSIDGYIEWMNPSASSRRSAVAARKRYNTRSNAIGNFNKPLHKRTDDWAARYRYG